MLYFSILQFCLLKGALCMIEITQGPQNVTVEEGESAVFTCSYTGTFEFPTWHINRATYAIQGETLGLPERHRYSNQMMTVRDVQASDNGTTYSCSFLFGTIASSEATLTVLSASSATQETSTTNPTSLATFGTTESDITSHLPVTFSDSQESHSATTGLNEPVTEGIHSNESTNFVQILSIGIACGVVIILTSIITCVILTCLIWRGTRHKSHTLRQDVEPTYEYVKDVLPVTSDWEVKVESNVCYATGITQEPNICYVTGLGETKESEYAEIQSGATVITTRLNEAYGRANQVARQVTTNATTCTSGQDEGEKELPQSSPDSVRAHQQDSQRNSTIDE